MKNPTILLLLALSIYTAYLSVSEQTKQEVDLQIQNTKTELKKQFGVAPKKTIEPHCALTFVSPLLNTRNIKSPLKVEVIVDNSKDNCHWGVFEAQAGLVSLVTDNNISVGKNTLETKGDWMTEFPVTYTSEIVYSLNGYTGPLKLKFVDENPSGNGQHQTAFFTVYSN